MLTGLALIAHAVEGAFPPPFAGIPVRLGLANLFVLCALLWYGPWEAGAVQLGRTLLGALFASSPSGLLYGLGGGAAAWGTMCLLLPAWRKKKVSPMGLSAAGSFAFNTAQLMVGLFLNGPAMAAYFPWMCLFSLGTGLLTGFLAALVVPRVRG